MITIFLRTISGPTTPLVLPVTATIPELKQLICDRLGMDPRHQKLYFFSACLSSSEQALLELGIGDGDMVTVMFSQQPVVMQHREKQIPHVETADPEAKKLTFMMPLFGCADSALLSSYVPPGLVMSKTSKTTSGKVATKPAIELSQEEAIKRIVEKTGCSAETAEEAYLRLGSHSQAIREIVRKNSLAKTS